MNFRPIVSTSNSYMVIMSLFLFQHERAMKLCPAYLKDSWQLLNDLKKMGPLPKKARKIRADAVDM
jgi:hypothetical protein